MKTKCCYCESFENAVEIYPANFDSNSFSTEVFSARRIPDRRYFRWVACNTCGQYRSDPVQALDLDTLYKDSTFDYSDESKSLAKTYFKMIRTSLSDVTGKSLLEIGGGNGFVLDYALHHGIGSILGVEPSTRAVESASSQVKPFMIVSMFKRGVVSSESFDCAAMFHVLDHLPSPLETLQEIHNALKPGGVVVIAVHDVRSWSARVFKSRSPIFDVEHTYLFSKESGTRILQKAGFSSVTADAYWNTYSLKYLIQLLPIHRGLKLMILKGRVGKLLSAISFPVPLGNMVLIGSKK